MTKFLKEFFKLQTNGLTNKQKRLNSISLTYFLMLLKAIYFLDKKYGLTLHGQPWVIKKSNKVIGTYILSLKIKEAIYSYDLVSFHKVFSFHQYHHLQQHHPFFSFFNILVDSQVFVLHWSQPFKHYKTCYFRMTVQMLLIFYDFCEKLSVVSLAESIKSSFSL